MARVLIDTSVAGEGWIKEVLPDLIKCKNVKFVYSDYEKYRDEVVRCNFLGKFLKLMKQKEMREDTDPAVCERIVTELSATKEWADDDDCDDPQIFAIAYQKPDVFVFTSDKRLVRCKASMTNVLDKRYRAFSTIQSKDNYDANEHRIKA